MTVDHQDATFYVQIEPQFSPWHRDASGEYALIGAKAVAITQKRPTKKNSGAVVAKLTVRIPSAAFLPLRPEAIVVVPEDLVGLPTVDVEVGDPS